MSRPPAACEFSDYVISRVEPAVSVDGIVGWNLYLVGGGSTWLTSEHCAVTPQPGEIARCYGRGIGFHITGIAIGGRTYR